MRGERRRDTDVSRSTEAGRDRVVFDAAGMFQRHVRWVACMESSRGAGGDDVCMRGECRHDVDITRSTEAGRDPYRTKFPNSVASVSKLKRLQLDVSQISFMIMRVWTMT